MSAVAARRLTAPLVPMVAKQSYAEFIKLIRVPAFSTTSIVLPTMFYVLIGLGQRNQAYEGVKYGVFFLASMALYGVANVMVLGFGISLANERGQKQDLLMQATPLRPIVFFVAKTVSALAIALLALVLLDVVAATLGGVQLSLDQWWTLSYRTMLCSIPFVGLGFALGYLSGPNSAAAVTNLIYLPTAFVSGLFFPLQLLPKFLQDFAPYVPLYRGAQLVWSAIGARTTTNIGEDWLWMAGYTVVFFLIALYAYRRDQGRKFN